MRFCTVELERTTPHPSLISPPGWPFGLLALRHSPRWGRVLEPLQCLCKEGPLPGPSTLQAPGNGPQWSRNPREQLWGGTGNRGELSARSCRFWSQLCH